MTAKLNQIIAIEKGTKSRTHSVMSDLYKIAQKPDLFNGLAKVYDSAEEGGETLPPDNKRVQFSVKSLIEQVSHSLSDLMNVTARKDWANCVAKGTVTINDKVILADVPVSHLLFLEKQLTDLRTFVGTLPTLDIAEDWTLDPNSGLFKTETTKTHRTKKVQRPLVLYPATPEHPAQTQIVTEDVLAGYWNTTKQSGAMRVPDKQTYLDRIDSLIKAIKEAREAANMADEVTTPNVGDAIFSYVFENQPISS